MKRIILAVSLWCGVAWGQAGDPTVEPEIHSTDGWHNCRYWSTISNGERIGILVGYRDFINTTNLGGALSFIRDMLDRIPVTYNDSVSGITKECKAPENVNLPIYESLAIFLYRLSGATEPEVSQYAVECRRRHLPVAVQEKKK